MRSPRVSLRPPNHPFRPAPSPSTHRERRNTEGWNKDRRGLGRGMGLRSREECVRKGAYTQKGFLERMGERTRNHSTHSRIEPPPTLSWALLLCVILQGLPILAASPQVFAGAGSGLSTRASRPSRPSDALWGQTGPRAPGVGGPRSRRGPVGLSGGVRRLHAARVLVVVVVGLRPPIPAVVALAGCRRAHPSPAPTPRLAPRAPGPEVTLAPLALPPPALRSLGRRRPPG